MRFLSWLPWRRRRPDPAGLYRFDENDERIMAVSALFDIPPEMLRSHMIDQDCRCFPTKEDK